jgi:hypothetical protein
MIEIRASAGHTVRYQGTLSGGPGVPGTLAPGDLLRFSILDLTTAAPIFVLTSAIPGTPGTPTPNGSFLTAYTTGSATTSATWGLELTQQEIAAIPLSAPAYRVELDWLDSNDAFRALLMDEGVLSMELAPVAPLYSPLYAARSDVENLFGATNVQKWSDVDNQGNVSTVANRVNWSLSLASTKLDDLLRGGPYAVPFTAPFPLSLTDSCARLAGVLLYDSRGIRDMDVDNNPIHQMQPHRTMVEQWVRAIRAGRLRLNVTPMATNFPIALREPSKVEENMFLLDRLARDWPWLYSSFPGA